MKEFGNYAMKMRFLPDEPITINSEDRLGFGDFVMLTQNSIYHTKPPFVYGILGDWGTGKTSVLHLLKSGLEKDFQAHVHTFVPIWFNAWQYENETNLIYPLLYAIKQDYDHRVGRFDETKEFGKKFLELVATSTLALTDIALRVAAKQLIGETLTLKDLAENLKTIQEHPGNLEQVLNRWADHVTELHHAFETFLETYASELAILHRGITKDDIRFVILVDDLDRCLPDTTIAILESIKNYLSVKNCVFVLGLNAKVIYQGIRVKYRGLDIDGREYLEKILNYSFYIPEPELEEVAKFATHCLEELVLEEEGRNLYKGCFAEFGRVLKECRFSNPRKIKRILNRYLLFLSKYHAKTFDNNGVIRLIIIAEYYSDIFQLLLRKYHGEEQIVLQGLADIHSGQFDVKDFEEKFGILISSRYLQLAQMGNLFDFTDLSLETFSLAQDVFTITRIH